MVVLSYCIREVMDMLIFINFNVEGVMDMKFKGYLEFDNVIFVYLGEIESFVLYDIFFKVKFGEIIVFIGLIGLGKFFFVNLILCFYDVIFGKILVDGVDVRDYNFKLFC